MTNEELEREIGHLATKEDLATLDGNLRTELHKELLSNTRWLVGTMIVLQIPTWVAMVQIWSFLATIAAKLPK